MNASNFLYYVGMKKNKIIVMIIPLLLFVVASVIYAFLVNAEAKRDVFFDSLDDVYPDVIEKAMSLESTDKELGEPYKVYPIETSPDSSEVFYSTLIEYPFGSSPRAEPQNTSLRGIILYVHGYNDYYFQKELAEKADSAGYAFFAIDLHYCGRSYAAGDRRADMRSVKEFYSELDIAVELCKKIAVDDYEEAENFPFIILGHSQGGLIASLYVADRDERFAALVLNSPFLQLNSNWFERNIVASLLSEVALFMPDFSAETTGDPNYAYSLMKSEKGEWEYNLKWKSVTRPTLHLGWLRAILRAQSRVHSRLNIKPPVLVMHSGCSAKSETWTDDYSRCDVVLDVDAIEEWAPYLGEDVTTKTIQGGLHDLLLSRKEVRDNAYREMLNFIDGVVQ